MIVEPTKRKPRFLRSFEILSERGVLDGISLRVLKEFFMVEPWTKDQMYLSNDPNSFCTFRKAFALSIVEDILRRFLTMSGFFNNVAWSFAVNWEIFLMFQLANAFL